jgi:thioredoxin reductase (NADPH)
MDFDCVIVGGGPAGLTAATYLGRFRRRVVVVDAGQSRAQQIPESHNYPGFSDGIAGPALLKLMHAQATQYGAEIVRGTVTGLRLVDGGFSVDAEGRTITAPRVLLATGLADKTPDMPGLAKAVANTSVRYCPVCDGYEATDKNIAVYGDIEDAEAKTVFLRTYSRTVTLLPRHGAAGPEVQRRLAQAGVTLAPSPPADFRPVDAGVEVDLQDGTRQHFDVLYPALGCKVHSQLATALGARCNHVGCLEVDDKQRTTIDGIYAAGDVVSDLHQLAVAAGHAGIAATAIHRSLPTNFR